MSSLTDFLQLNAKTEIQNLYVYNTTQISVTDGGRCCCAVVPLGITFANVEIWGGGGGGNGGCCCQWPYGMASPGHYTLDKFAVVPGQALTICAGGSTCCGPNCKGPDGFPSFVSRSGTVLACAAGGIGGCALCFYKGAFPCTGLCVGASRQDQAHVGDLGICTTQGMSVTHNFCASDMFEALSGSPKFAQNLRIGASHCNTPEGSYTRSGCDRATTNWPGGAGNGGSGCGGGCCWGGWGASGLVILTFYG